MIISIMLLSNQGRVKRSSETTIPPIILQVFRQITIQIVFARQYQTVVLCVVSAKLLLPPHRGYVTHKYTIPSIPDRSRLKSTSYLSNVYSIRFFFFILSSSSCCCSISRVPYVPVLCLYYSTSQCCVGGIVCVPVLC